MRCIEGDGTFYTFANIEAMMADKGFISDIEWCEALLKENKVALVPGSAFGAPGHCRLSFATDLDTLKEAVARITAFANN